MMNDHYSRMACAGIHSAAAQYERPSVMYRPRLYLDGGKYCALYGDNIMSGCAGFGDTAAAAMWDFDQNWQNQNAPQPCKRCKGTGAIDAPYSGSDPSCPDCDGEGVKP